MGREYGPKQKMVLTEKGLKNYQKEKPWQKGKYKDFKKLRSVPLNISFSIPQYVVSFNLISI